MVYLLMALSWALFYTLHLVLASKIKRFLEAGSPHIPKKHRLFYCLLGPLLFLGILTQAAFLPPDRLLVTGKFGQYAGYLLSTVGIILVSRALRLVPLYPFHLLSGPPLVTGGIYGQVRHPFFLGLILIFLGYFIVAGTWGALLHLGCLLAFLPFGIHFEEKNLKLAFGAEYEEYREAVASLFPKLPWQQKPE